MRTGEGIICPGCGARNSKVIESRDKIGSVYRRRVCLVCACRYTTEERLKADPPKGATNE